MLWHKAQGAGGLVAPPYSKVLYSVSRAPNALVTTDVSNPSAMSTLDYLSDGLQLDGANSVIVDVVREIAFVTCLDDRELTAVDVSNTSQMAVVGNYYNIDLATALADALPTLDAERELVFVGGYYADKFLAIDVSDVANMTLAGQTTASTFLEEAAAAQLDLERAIAFVVTKNYLTAVDVSNPAAMTIISSLTLNGNDVRHLTIDTTTGVAYLTVFNSSTLDLTTVDISNPSAMSYIGTFSSANVSQLHQHALDLDTKIMYLFRASDSVVSVDVSNPASMVQLDYLQDSRLENPASGVVDSEQGVLYVASRTSGAVAAITSVDVSNPTSLAILDVHNGPSSSPSGWPAYPYTDTYDLALNNGLSGSTNANK